MTSVNAFASAAADDLFPEQTRPEWEDLEAAAERVIEQYPDATRELYVILAEALMLASSPSRRNEAQTSLKAIGENNLLTPLRCALPKLMENCAKADLDNTVQRIGIEAIRDGLGLLPS